MPKTIFKIRTFMCPQCRFHRAIYNMPANLLCPTHGQRLMEMSQPDDQITVTVSGEDEIDQFVIYKGECVRIEWMNALDNDESQRAMKGGRPPVFAERHALSDADRVEFLRTIRESVAFHSQFQVKKP